MSLVRKGQSRPKDKDSETAFYKNDTCLQIPPRSFWRGDKYLKIELFMLLICHLPNSRIQQTTNTHPIEKK
jgi:hypothetical protein